MGGRFEGENWDLLMRCLGGFRGDIGVLPGRGSEETWMEAPVVSLISLIFTPSFPMIAPHWLLGTNRFRCKSSSSSPSPDLLPDSLKDHPSQNEMVSDATFESTFIIPSLFYKKKVPI